MKPYKIGKKGTMLDFIFIILAFALISSLTILFVWKGMDVVKPILDGLSDANGQAAIQQVYDYSKVFDYGFAIVFFATCLFSIIFAYFIKTHPAFMFVTLFIDIVIIIIASYTQQIYTNILGLDTLSSVNGTFPIMNFIMNHFTITIIALIILQLIIMYSALRSDAL